MTAPAYRWLSPEGAPVSPVHRTPETAARWLARAPNVALGGPAALVRDDRPRDRHVPPTWRPLTAAEAERALDEIAARGRAPRSAAPWIRRKGRMVIDRRRKRSHVLRLTSRLAGTRRITGPRQSRGGTYAPPE